MIRVEEVTSSEGFSALSPQWNELLRAGGRPSLFLSFQWLQSWWMCHTHAGNELCLLIARDTSGVIGLAPLQRVKRRYLGIPFAMMEFLSTSMYADHPSSVSASLDWIILRKEREVLAAFLEHLLSSTRSWQLLRLHPLPVSSPLRLPLREEAERRTCRVYERVITEDAVIHCTPSWEAFYPSLSGHFRQRLNRSQRDLSALGGIEFTQLDADPEGRFFRRLLDVERRSWKWRRGVSLNSVAFGDFYRAFAIAAARDNLLRLWIMKLAGEDIAYDLCATFSGELYCLKKSYDERYHRFSPGALLERHLYEAACREGMTRIHMLWGDTGHKRRWGSVLEDRSEVLIFGPGPGSQRVHTLLVDAHLASLHRPAADYTKRIMRKIGVRSVHSELTRMDQL